MRNIVKLHFQEQIRHLDWLEHGSGRIRIAQAHMTHWSVLNGACERMRRGDHDIDSILYVNAIITTKFGFWGALDNTCERRLQHRIPYQGFTL